MILRRACPACGSERRQVVRQQTGVDTYLELAGVSAEQTVREWQRCSDCRHVFNSVQLEERELELLYQRFREEEWRRESPDQYFDRITGLPSEESENHQKVQLIVQSLGSALASEGKLLDIGCGGGVLIDMLRRELPRGWSFYGVEPTPSFASLAQRRTGALVKSSMYASGLFVGELFSAATCCQVLEHVPDPPNFLAQVHADLERGAWFYLEVPDESDFETLGRDHDRFMSQHISYFSNEVLGRMLESQGFEVLQYGVCQTIRRRNNLWYVTRVV